MTANLYPNISAQGKYKYKIVWQRKYSPKSFLNGGIKMIDKRK